MVPSWRSSRSRVPGLFFFGCRASSAPPHPRAPGVTGRSDCAQPPAPVGPGQRRGSPPSTTSLYRCESCPGESSRPTPHPSATRPKPVLLKGIQSQARPPQGTEQGICVGQRRTRTAELSSPSAHSLYQGPGLPPPGAALASALGLSSGHALCMSCAYPRSQRLMRHR